MKRFIKPRACNENIVRVFKNCGFFAFQLLLAAAILIFSLVSAPRAHAFENQLVATLSSLQYTVVISGDSVIRISKRFGVSAESVLAANPTVASRNDPARHHWIYLGETLTVPVYKMETKNDAGVTDSSLVAVAMKAVREAEESIAASEKKVGILNAQLDEVMKRVDVAEVDLYVTGVEKESLTEKNTALVKKAAQLEFRNSVFLGIIVSLLAVALATLIVYMLTRTPASSDSKKVLRPNATKETKKDEAHAECCAKTKTPLSEEDETKILLKEMQMTDGGTLAELVNMEVAKDACGNPIFLKNVGDFIKKRPHLPLASNPPSKWQEILAEAEKQRKIAGGLEGHI